MENTLEERNINNSELTEQTPANGQIKHTIPSQGQFPSQDALAFTPTGQRVEHVEEDEAGESHGGVAGIDAVVGGHFVPVDAQRAEHDYGGGCEDSLDETTGKDACGSGAGRSIHYCGIDGLDA